MKANKQEYLKHVLSQLKMAYQFENWDYVTQYSIQLDKIIDEQIKFNEHE